jgi:hypothetical protein
MLAWIAEKDARICEAAELCYRRLKPLFKKPWPLNKLAVVYMLERLMEPAYIGNKLSFEPGDYTCTWYTPPLKHPEDTTR